MRVIRGQLKGRRLVCSKGSHLRPMMDRVKESIFNILEGHVQGALVLDLFAGTGSLSIEAFSQGARQVIAVEKHPKSVKVILNNLTKLQIKKESIQVYQKDVFAFLKKHRPNEKYDLILIDPPFTQKLADRTMRELAKSTVFKDETIIVIESSQHEKLCKQYGPLSSFDCRSFGDKFVSFFKAR